MNTTYRFAAAVNCIDGRVQEPVRRYLTDGNGTDFVDMITEPGPVKMLADGADEALLASIRRRLDVSVRGHGVRTIAVVAHHDCLANPLDEASQRKQLEAASERLRAWYPEHDILALWVAADFRVHRHAPPR